MFSINIIECIQFMLKCVMYTSDNQSISLLCSHTSYKRNPFDLQLQGPLRRRSIWPAIWWSSAKWLRSSRYHGIWTRLHHLFRGVVGFEPYHWDMMVDLVFVCFSFISCVWVVEGWSTKPWEHAAAPGSHHGRDVW
jgi:hypothetical protein